MKALAGIRRMTSNAAYTHWLPANASIKMLAKVE
jgi:hypothetical protein